MQDEPETCQNVIHKYFIYKWTNLSETFLHRRHRLIGLIFNIKLLVRTNSTVYKIHGMDWIVQCTIHKSTIVLNDKSTLTVIAVVIQAIYMNICQHRTSYVIILFLFIILFIYPTRITYKWCKKLNHCCTRLRSHLSKELLHNKKLKQVLQCSSVNNKNQFVKTQKLSIRHFAKYHIHNYY